MLVVGSKALGMERRNEIDAWGSLEELEALKESLHSSFIVDAKYDERKTLTRSSRQGRVFVDYEILDEEMVKLVEALPDSSSDLIYDAYPVKRASKLTCCMIKLAAIETVPNVQSKHAEDLKELWPDGLREAIEASAPHKAVFEKFKAILEERYKE